MSIKAIFPAGVTDLTVHGLHQWDRGQMLEIYDSTLPAQIEVHFAHCDVEIASTVLCSVSEGVAAAKIPDRCLQQTTPVLAWVYEINDTSGKTIRTITMPLIARARPDNVTGGSAYVDVSDTTATEEEVLKGEVFHKADGSTAVGTLVPSAAIGEVPTFNLTDMGLPVVPTTGETKDLEHESVEDICAALDAGPVKFILTIDDYGETEIIMTKASTGGGVYHCSHAVIMSDTVKLINLTFEGGYISVRVSTISGTGTALPTVSAADNGKTLSVIDGEWSAAKPASTLPAVTENDNGKTLSVIDGEWSAAKPASTLPAVTENDNGKVLSVVGGAWAADEVASGEIPFFDLAEMGLPEVPSDGTTADLTVDTTEIKSALDNGCVKFAFNVEDAGRVEIVLNKYSIDAYGLYICSYSVPDGSFMLMIADGSIQASVVPQSTIPAVTESDNGKILTVVDGAWAASTPATGGATIPSYDLTAMGLSTVTVGGGFADLTTDTTQIRNDLISGSVKLTLTMTLGDYAMPISKICNAVVIDGAGEMYITFVAHIAGMVVHTSLDILDGRIQARSETLESIVTPYIDAYIGDVLGGEY